MSDEFMRIATKEVNDEISEISKILNSCKNDADIIKNAIAIEKHVHKIKGLAPMMGKEEIGYIAVLIDKILKHMIDGNKLEKIYEILGESNTFMKNSMQDNPTNSEEIKQKIETNYSNILN